MVANPQRRLEIIVNVTGIGIGIKVNFTGIRIGIGIIEFVKHLNRNQIMLELESKSESKFWATLESESESESPGINFNSAMDDAAVHSLLTISLPGGATAMLMRCS